MTRAVAHWSTSAVLGATWGSDQERDIWTIVNFAEAIMGSDGNSQPPRTPKSRFLRRTPTNPSIGLVAEDLGQGDLVGEPSSL